MGVLSNLEPKSVFTFFEEITKIPHGSGNIEEISDYLVRFAKERGIACVQDELKNVILIKEATPGYEKEPAVILQGHMDMVAVKKPDCRIDMAKEGLQVAINGDRIYAEGTSLGGDDGIAVAYALALLDADHLHHPKLEVIITVDEEVGMDGACGIDLSMLTGNRMINLDSEEEGIFLSSCAGGARAKCRMPLPMQEREGLLAHVKVGGLLGGHSGAEIHKERGNANCLLARILYEISKQVPILLVEAEGGLADNAIPREAVASVLVDKADYEKLLAIVEASKAQIAAEYATKDPGFYAEVSCGEEIVLSCAGDEETKRALAFLITLPNGIRAMSADMPGLVETSLNMGIFECKNGSVLAEFAVRSSVESAKWALLDQLCALTDLVGGTVEITGEYPGWKYRKDSPLRDKMVALYEKMYGASPKVEAIHAGLECGILGSKIKDLDCVSIGPDMADIHTTEETLSISSTKRVWEYLVALLEEK
jgi:dipeptidase D